MKKPQVIILDEATSSLDLSTEAEVQEAFQKLRSGRILFFVAYRQSNIIHADLILFVEDGNTLSCGSVKIGRQNKK
jgi:ABC-type multidrug transport system fused ATPase/permease subunit